MKLKLLTLNIHGWLEEDQLAKFERIADYIYDNEIDIVALQEVNQHKESNILGGVVRTDNPSEIICGFLREKGREYKYVWDWSHYGYDVYEEGVSILTRHDIVSSESRYVSQSKEKDNWKSRNIIKGIVKVEEREINVFSCHMGWYGDEADPFEAQMERLNEFMQESEGPVLAMGDFNNPDISDGYKLIKSYGIKDLYREGSKAAGNTIFGSIAGWEENDEGFRIDYIFGLGDMKGIEGEVVFEEEPVSDHSGVYVQIEI